MTSHNKAVGARAQGERSKHILFHSTGERAVPHRCAGCDHRQGEGQRGSQLLSVATAETLYDMEQGRCAAVHGRKYCRSKIFIGNDAEEWGSANREKRLCGYMVHKI